MDEHLSSDRVSAWLAGERSKDDERHLQDCPECAAGIRRMEDGLTAFTHAVRSWADCERSESISIEVGDRSGPLRRRWRWALAAAAAAFAIGIPSYRNVPTLPHQWADPEDARLLARVNAQLSRAVPAPMEPLLELMQEERTDIP